MYKFVDLNGITYLYYRVRKIIANIGQSSIIQGIISHGANE